MSKIPNFFISVLLVILISGCLFSSRISFRGKGDIILQQSDFASLPQWKNSKSNYKLALLSFINSCNKFAKMAENREIGNKITNISVKDFRDVCDIAHVIKTMEDKYAKNFFENWFTPFIVKNKHGNSNGLFTGYYEATLYGSKEKSERYKYPIYKKPKELTSDPYYTREEIENGAIKNRDLEILYVDNKVDLFFLHVQGSGRVILEDGNEVKIGFAAKNNQPYRSIGAYIEEQGYMSGHKVNAASIKDWLSENEDKQNEIMNYNNSYIFFRVLDDEYIVGAQGVPLTPEHSIAIDNDIMPYGFPIWVETKLKDKKGNKTPYSSLLISQDTGSAIKGEVRGDIFFGHGKEQEQKAYYMASRGKYYILLPNNVVEGLK